MLTNFYNLLPSYTMNAHCIIHIPHIGGLLTIMQLLFSFDVKLTLKKIRNLAAKMHQKKRSENITEVKIYQKWKGIKK